VRIEIFAAPVGGCKEGLLLRLNCPEAAVYYKIPSCRAVARFETHTGIAAAAAAAVTGWMLTWQKRQSRQYGEARTANEQTS
jgi:hypothetical protein